MRRCLVTKNECGSDTWSESFTCPCLQCRAYLAERRLKTDSTYAKRRWLATVAALGLAGDHEPQAATAGGPTSTPEGSEQAGQVDRDDGRARRGQRRVPA